MSPGTKLAIALPLSLLCLSLALSALVRTSRLTAHPHSTAAQRGRVTVGVSLQWIRVQKQKLLWDESWIIDFGAIKPGKGQLDAGALSCDWLIQGVCVCVCVDQDARVTMGSIMSAPVGNSDSNTSCVTALSSWTGQAGNRRSVFTCTGIQ